jgi:two-component system, OmpR family, heavy metal sensor histidine kinase CusS
MIRSFRLRIALLSALLAGSTLIGFGILTWKLIYDAKVSRLDASLESQLKRVIRPRGNDRWQFYESSLPRELGISANTPVALVVIGTDDRPLYQSENWATTLNPNSFLPPRPQAPLPSPPRIGTPPNYPFPRPDRANLPPPEFPATFRYTTAKNWRVGAMSSPYLRAAIAIDLQDINQEMGVIRNIFLIAIPSVLLLVAGGAWSLSGSALYPIRQLTHAIQKVSIKGLDQRVSSYAIDVEFVQLIQVFNQMLERLERSFKQASRFSADAAHELKTPLTILQGELEQTLQQVETGSAMQQRLGSLLDEVCRLSDIVRKLLLLSLADAGQMSLYRAEVNIFTLLTDLIEDLELLAPELTVQTEVATELRVWGDRDLLIQVLQNLFSNAIKYNLPHGWICIQARQQLDTVVVTISNASKEIPERDRPLIFDRFHRGDPARTRKVEGTGLGLSLSREIARAHGGDLILEPALPGQTAFTLRLPGAGAFHETPPQSN